jgi:hypothetical protein
LPNATEKLPLWFSLAALSVIAGLGVTLVSWLVRGELTEHRRRRAVARIRRQYQRPALPAAPTITVDELVARLTAEGLPVRLDWDRDEHPGDNDWPTGVLPKTDGD